MTHDEYSQSELARPIPTYSGDAERYTSINRYSINISSSDQAGPLHRRRSNTTTLSHNMDKVKWAYTKVAILFAVSIFITWVPSSVNRVYSLRYPEPNYALNISSAVVLPLQGFWNTVIYFTTSASTCKRVWNRFKGRKRRASRFVMLETAPRRRDGKDRGSVVEMSRHTSRELTIANSP